MEKKYRLVYWETLHLLPEENRLHLSQGFHVMPARPSGKGRTKERLSFGKSRMQGDWKWTVGVSSREIQLST